MISFKGHSDGKVIVPDEPVDLPKDQPLRVIVKKEEEEKTAKTGKELSFLKLAREISEKFKGAYPSDLAENHDHYLHGGPKR